MDRVRIALVGAGAIGRKHADLLVRSGNARLSAVVDPVPEAAVLAQACGAIHLPSLDDLPGGIDGVILATPTPLHAAGAQACIARGLPVLVEKPVTATVAEARALADAASRAGVPVLVGHHRRHNPRIAAARAAIADGMLGRVVAAEVSVLLCKPAAYFDPPWRRQPGAGPILTNLIHEIDTLRHLLGQVVDVEAMSSNAVRGFAVEDSAAVLLRFDTGVLATVIVSDAAAAPWSWELTAAENDDYPVTGQSSTRIAGTRGALELPTLRLWRHAGSPGWHVPMTCEALSVQDADPLAAQLDHFAAVIRGDAEPLVSVTDAAASLAVVERIAAASARPAENLQAERTAS